MLRMLPAAIAQLVPPHVAWSFRPLMTGLLSSHRCICCAATSLESAATHFWAKGVQSTRVQGHSVMCVALSRVAAIARWQMRAAAAMPAMLRGEGLRSGSFSGELAGASHGNPGA